MKNLFGIIFIFITWLNPLMGKATKAEDFTAFKPQQDFQLPEIVLQYDAVAQSGANWGEVNQAKWHENTAPVILGRAAGYLQDGLKRMTGKDFPIVSKNDLSRGIVLTLLKNASEDIRNDPEVQDALKPDTKDPYAANEAFYLRSETNRLLVVANTPNGLVDAVAKLLESVDYEILGMGTDWIYAPDHRNGALIFRINRSERPSFYIRKLWAHSGQSWGVGTIMTGLADPSDESVDVSYMRWRIGAHFFGSSMPLVGGHALQQYHRKIMDKMRETASPEGFLAMVKVGTEAQRPPASPEIKGLWWMNTDLRGTPGFEKKFTCDGKEWQPYLATNYLGSSVDVSAPIVRDIVLEDMKQKAEAIFKADPDALFIFNIEPEDGGVHDGERLKTMANRNWYPEYLKKENLPFGRPYVLNGHKGLNQPTEMWDPSSASDNLFGFAGYLLHEFDKWIDSLPKDQQITSTGKSKKELIRCGLQSYNYHDIPPNFNPDQRIQVLVAPFPKHRGAGKWENISTSEDIAGALHIMLPDEPSANYFFYSFSYYGDGGPSGIPAAWEASPKVMAETYRRYYDVGFRSITCEIDLNFGKYGLGYYLAGKMLWNVNLTTADLDAIRNRWMQRAFGSAWKEMKAYYDFLLPSNYGVNSPNSWAKATHLLDIADKKLNGEKEPEAQRRIDDLKQYWYSHYLLDFGKYAKDSPEVREYLWKGQMSYMVGMQGLLGRDYDRRGVKDVVGPEISAGPAHYTHAETQVWWAKVLDLWKVTPVKLFTDATMADGKLAKNVDLNDLVMVKEFQMAPTDAPFLYNSSYMKSASFLMAAAKKDDFVGFRLVWPSIPFQSYGAYEAKNVSYGADIWNPSKNIWEPWIDQSMTSQGSTEIADATGRKLQLVDVKHKAPRPGVYRFSIGRGGNLSQLGSPAWDPLTGKYADRMGFTRSNDAHGLSQSGVYFYIPKGTKSLDLEVWDQSKSKALTIYTGLPDKNFIISRKVDISGMGVHVIPLQAGEDGSFAMITGDNFFFPYLYSVPLLWAKSPAALLVPRAIAKADGLTVIDD